MSLSDHLKIFTYRKELICSTASGDAVSGIRMTVLCAYFRNTLLVRTSETLMAYIYQVKKIRIELPF
jgi:hypothetical protein